MSSLCPCVELAEVKAELEAFKSNPHDEYHTMQDLYQHRMALSAALANSRPDISVKSHLHHDGTMFEGGYFIVRILTPGGPVTYHYSLEDWDKFHCPEVDRIPEAYDEHIPSDCIGRLLTL